LTTDIPFITFTYRIPFSSVVLTYTRDIIFTTSSEGTINCLTPTHYSFPRKVRPSRQPTFTLPAKMHNPNPISSGLFILPDDQLYASDRNIEPIGIQKPKPIYTPPLTRGERIHSEPLNYARPFSGENNNLIPIDNNKRSNSYSSSSSSSSSSCSSSSTGGLVITHIPVRRVSRKSPPKITDSLEDLSRSISSSYSAQFPSPNFMPIETFILPVDPPTKAFLAPPRPPPRSARRPPPPALSRKATSMDNLLPSSIPSASASRITLQFPTRPQTSSSPSTPPRLSPSHTTSTDSSPPRTPRTPTRLQAHRPSESSASTIPLTCSSGSASTCGTWSLAEEAESADRVSSRVKESRKERKLRKIVEEERFDVDTPPSVRELFEASLLEVIGEDGKRVKFGDLIKCRKTIVVFIRHCTFGLEQERLVLVLIGYVVGFCPLCAQYMNCIMSEVSQEALYQADVDLIIIGNGSGKMLPAYKSMFASYPTGTKLTERHRQRVQMSFPDVHRSIPSTLPCTRPHSKDR
jgi:hypothetical protein